MPSVQKKRDLLPQLRDIINAFVDISDDVAILEMDDSDASSRRVRARLIDIVETKVNPFKEEIKNIRTGVVARKKNKE